MGIMQVEEKIKYCKRCEKSTAHIRNSKRTSGLMMLLHVALTVITWGAWLVVVLILMVFSIRIGGWHCKECNK